MKKSVFVFSFVSILFLGCGGESKSFNQYDRDGEQNGGDQEQFEGDFDDISDSDSVEESLNQDSDSGGAVSGYNCATIHRCVKHCGSDAACRAECIESGSGDGAKKYKNLTSCIDDNCMFLSEEETAECVNEDCESELKSCGLEEAEIGDFAPSASGGESGDNGGGVVDGSKCGNGKVGSSEVCDDGKNNGKYRTAFPGYCDSDCGGYGEGGFCGDGILQRGDCSGYENCVVSDGASEFCDDGTNNGKYGFCKGDCSEMGEYCGDGEKNGNEFCDEGEDNGKIGRCNFDCLGVCGDGETSGGEFCDDGEDNGKIGRCKSNCSGIGEYCGDGIKNGDEFCDDGEENGQTGRCDAECLKFLFPYLDSSSGLMWSGKASSTMTWNNAQTYCENLEEGGFSDWRLPTISELRTLIRECEATMTGGTCGVTDSCLESSCWSDPCINGCAEDTTGKYSLLGDTSYFWSSSPVAEYPDNAWYVGFRGGYVSYNDMSSNGSVRCVRKPL